MPAHTNWFATGGQAYARFRPEYPIELARFLASLAPAADLAVDVGCGSGQLTTQLAGHFARVIGLDPSADQIAHAPPTPGTIFICAPAERLPIADGCASLVTAAQAAHWFDLPRFYAEARRIAAPGAAMCLVSYGILSLDAGLDARFDRFYRQEIGPFWPAERRLVDNGYRDLPFPFPERPAPAMAICKPWLLEELLGYIATWSAVVRVREAGREDLLQSFAADLAVLWGDPSQRRTVRWPLNLRLGMC